MENEGIHLSLDLVFSFDLDFGINIVRVVVISASLIFLGVHYTSEPICILGAFSFSMALNGVFLLGTVGKVGVPGLIF